MKKNILIVDDSDSLRQLVKLGLQMLGYNVFEAANGKEALTVAESHQLNLIICDVNMPVMDGISFVRNLKTGNNNKFIPIVMLTTEGGEEKKMEGMSLGVKAWVVKPFQVDVLFSAVEKLII